MRGHDHIIALRKRGITPAFVFINDYPCDVDWFEYHEHATVEILPSESIDLLDMRFVVGLTVSISGSDLERVKAIAQRCKDAGAAVVAAGCSRKNERGFVESVWSDVWRRPVEQPQEVAEHG